MNVKKVGQMVFYVGLGVLVSGYFTSVYAVGSNPPSVTTTSATPSGTDGFVAGGNVTSSGDFPVTARGICWNTTGNPTIGDSNTTDGTGTGEFTSTVTGLSAGTMYYYRAYATNNEGTGYGSQMTITIPTVTTPTLTTISAMLNGSTGFDAGGNVTDDGGASVTARGVCWNTTGSPTISDGKTTDGTGTGTFTSTATGLTENTLYYFRAYATNSGGTAYGETLTIITGSSTVTLNYYLAPVTSLQTGDWRVVACSPDGGKIVAGSSSIYTSTDFGATWTEQTGAGSQSWWALACSADGTKMVIGTNPGSLFTSTDSGVTWTERTDPGTCQAWTSAACSSDGTKMVAVPCMGSIFTSTDSGTTWTARNSSRGWHGVCSSSDGVHLAAVVFSGYIYTSSDSGVTWTEQSAAGSQRWYDIACSSDGKKLVAVVNGGQIYTSTDYGVSWTARASNRRWARVTSSADGTHLVASREGGQLYRSNDSGATWTAFESNENWQGVALSSDGSKLAACDLYGYLYVKANPTTPTVNTPASSNIATTTATLGGTISDAGNADITECGIYWSTTGGFTPPTQGTKVSKTGVWTSADTFTLDVTGLPVNTTIYFKAFGTNSSGTCFSNEATFTTTAGINSMSITDDNGDAIVGNNTVNATVSGFDPELPVSIEENEDNDQVFTIGQTSSPRFAATISGAAAGTTISASANGETQQNTIQLTQPGGRKIRIVLVEFPEGANIGLNLGNVQQIVGNVTNQDGQAMDVEIRAVDDGGDITFILTYHPPAGNANAKVIWFAPGGSVTIEADGVPANGVYSISLSYAGVSLGRTGVADLRMMRVNGDGSMTAAGDSDLCNVSATDALGDYGIDTTAGKVWSNVDTLGTFAVGVPKTPVEEIRTVTTSYGCPIFGGLLLTLMCLGFVGLNEMRKF